MRPLVIIHGWSDHAKSFNNLSMMIEQQSGQHLPYYINLADYISLDDQITYDDLVNALNYAWHKKGLPLSYGSVDVIAHSTGALIVRHWLVKFFSPSQSPIKHLVLLAPANFGSSLAHKGREFYGRILRGLKSEKLFQVGAKLLKGLELASPYTLDLARKDLFCLESFYGPGKVLATILVGNKGYNGLAAAANEPGSDGVVRICAANLNANSLTIDFKEDPLNPKSELRSSSGKIAFGVIDGENHCTITGDCGGNKASDTIDLIMRALLVTDKEYPAWIQYLNNNYSICDDCAYDQIIVSVNDQFSNNVAEYFLELYETGDRPNRFAELFHQHLVKSVHVYGDDSSYRNFYIDSPNLLQYLNKSLSELKMSITALPELGYHGNLVGYRGYHDRSLGALSLSMPTLENLFSGAKTLLLEISLCREQLAEIFQLKDYEK